MSIDVQYRYVNGMRNIVWLAGFLRKRDGQYFVQQNNNTEQMIPFVVPDGFRMPPEFTPIEASCHIYGKREENEQQCVLKVIEVSRPSIRSMPAHTTWARGKMGKDDFRPFMSKTEIRRDLVDKIDQDEEATEKDKVLAEYFKSSGGKFDSRLGDNANRVLLAGYTGATRYVEPNKHQESGYGEIYLHQYSDPELAIPIRLYGLGAKNLLKDIRRGNPAAFVGQMRMKILPDDEGNIRYRSLHVRVEDVLVAIKDVDLLDIPLWWADLFKSGIREKKIEEAAITKPPVQSQIEAPESIEGL